MKQKRERKHNFIDVENEINYGESIVKKNQEQKTESSFVILQPMLPI